MMGESAVKGLHMTDTATSLAQRLIAHFEGCSLTPYICPAGRWTIGYGSTRMPDGERVIERVPAITQAQADDLLERTIHGIIRNIEWNVSVPLNENQQAALASFIYNVGLHNFANSTLRRKLNDKDYAGAANEFTRWNKGAGKVLRGLVRRRAVERAVFLGASVEQALGEAQV